MNSDSGKTAKLIGIIADKSGSFEPHEINETDHFINDLGFDSMDMVELIMAIEDAFHIKMADADVEKIATVGDAINYLQTH